MSGSANELSPQKTYRVMATVAIAIAALIGLAIFSLSRLSTAPWPSRLARPDLTFSSRQELPHFEYSDGKKMLSAQNFEGHWTLVSFWSHTCAPCLAELNGLNSLLQNWQGPPFELLTVNVDQGENLELAKQFLLDNEISLPTFFDTPGKLKALFKVEEYPRHFLVSPDLGILWSASGAFDWNQNSVRDQLIKLMEPKQPPDPESPAHSESP